MQNIYWFICILFAPYYSVRHEEVESKQIAFIDKILKCLQLNF